MCIEFAIECIALCYGVGCRHALEPAVLRFGANAQRRSPRCGWRSRMRGVQTAAEPSAQTLFTRGKVGRICGVGRTSGKSRLATSSVFDPRATS